MTIDDGGWKCSNCKGGFDQRKLFEMVSYQTDVRDGDSKEQMNFLNGVYCS